MTIITCINCHSYYDNFKLLRICKKCIDFSFVNSFTCNILYIKFTNESLNTDTLNRKLILKKFFKVIHEI